MTPKFEIEIWPDKQQLKKVFISIIVITVIAWACHLIGNIFWDEYSRTVTNLKGQTYQSGWPVTLYWWGIYIGIAGPVSFLLVLMMVDRKNPSLALSQNGLFINQQMIKKTIVEWSNIDHIEKNNKNGKIEIAFFFKDIEVIIKAQSGAKKAFLKENLKGGKPLICSNKLSVGNFDDLYTKATFYLQGNNH
ncbi:MAG: hypothetical protein A2W91_06585 [Bacteroidetes bacterium GWF2_38_335]|nr:MAG: hypothetical protein A2W91_06585 [Bacteroidetes bacterium GWF2_38_335]OFY77697.1 MAG: hypothetical protein A2281_18100 [Bacteroidetes bacterium RIFOXYA12_FULL_38_20]HBS89072.1 hypothetical protein [Bacteroidales bacterium]